MWFRVPWGPYEDPMIVVSHEIQKSLKTAGARCEYISMIKNMVAIRELTSVQPKRSLFSASPTERKGCLLLAVGSKKKWDLKNVGKKDK